MRINCIVGENQIIEALKRADKRKKNKCKNS